VPVRGDVALQEAVPPVRPGCQTLGCESASPSAHPQCALVPTRTVEHHDHVFLRVAAGNFGDEQLHAFGVELGQHQGVEFSIHGRNCALSVGVLVGEHRLDHGSHGTTRQAVARVADATQPGLVLKHQTHRSGGGKTLYDFVQYAGEFFFHSCRAWGSPWG
jgi:hypothetical protein